ncbi:MAG: ROK family protein [Candidatus Doudnabacteria bacterium]
MKYILGIDVGGTKIASGLVDKNYKVSKVSIVPTSQTDLIGQLQRLIAGYQGFIAIGLGLPGPVMPDGTVTRLPNLKAFKKANVGKILEKKFKVPVHVMNDAKAFALSEAVLGAGSNFKVVCGVILGTGIGVGIVINKQIYRGKDGVAGEMEHITLLDGRMIRYYRKMVKSFDQVSQAQKFLRTILSIIVLSFNPDIIILGGGWSKLNGMERLANQLTKNVGDYETSTPVKISKLKHAGIIGAALPLLKH